MSLYEYKAIPAPLRSSKIKGVKRPEEKLAITVSDVMNRMAADGWEYLRADTLPCEEGGGFMSRPKVSFQTLLVFRREQERAVAPQPVGRPTPAHSDRSDVRVVQRLWGREKPQPDTPAQSEKPALVAAAPEGATPRIVADRPMDSRQS